VDRHPVFNLVAPWMTELLDGLDHPWAVCGGAVRDVIRGKTPHDIDIMSFATTRALLDAITSRRNDATVKAPYTLGGKGKVRFPAAGWISKADIEPIVIGAGNMEVWSCLEYGWTGIPKGRIEEFDFSCNAIAAWSDGTLSADDEVLHHIKTGQMAILTPKRALRPHRVGHMQAKGFRLVSAA